MTVDEYFKLPETNRPQELVYGYLREPPSPTYGHQSALFSLAVLLRSHVRQRALGEVCVSPLDVVLDKEANLVVQPDILFVSTERLEILQDRVWGAPDLVVEVASPSTEYRDRSLKFAWYKRYGVRECWLVYPQTRRIEVIDCKAEIAESFTGAAAIRSNVLPDFAAPANDCFT